MMNSQHQNMMPHSSNPESKKYHRQSQKQSQLAHHSSASGLHDRQSHVNSINNSIHAAKTANSNRVKKSSHADRASSNIGSSKNHHSSVSTGVSQLVGSKSSKLQAQDQLTQLKHQNIQGRADHQGFSSGSLSTNNASLSANKHMSHSNLSAAHYLHQ